ncbi:hypothetical protein EVAR_73112_1 [Eumeta japonica]|uniref:Uncharacterized protein n=1 Tax=Eumeta variegata TaxID=151549 RepID=A0A4C1SXA5_EUMVA|nr:hypothetical protein EVAR_73112_1 [Eumeta japonica]
MEYNQQQIQQKMPASHQIGASHGFSQPNSGQPAFNNSTVPAPEPDMCTTCPNCQTTIYLVRGSDEMANQQNVNNSQQIIAGSAPPTAAGSM